MAFYRICPDCGASLDPGEKCDCQEEKEHEAQKFKSMFTICSDGQLQLNLFKEVTGVDKASIK